MMPLVWERFIQEHMVKYKQECANNIQRHDGSCSATQGRLYMPPAVITQCLEQWGVCSYCRFSKHLGWQMFVPRNIGRVLPHQPSRPCDASALPLRSSWARKPSMHSWSVTLQRCILLSLESSELLATALIEARSGQRHRATSELDCRRREAQVILISSGCLIVGFLVATTQQSRA